MPPTQKYFLASPARNRARAHVLPTAPAATRHARLPATARWAVAVAAALALTACGGDDKKVATQVAAKVNKEEISVHQINFVLQRTPNLTPERAAQAKKDILERLIEQEVLVQQAMDNKLDRKPDVQQQLEAARREVLARAYLQQVAAGVKTPEKAEVEKFFAEKPELFSKRRIYRFNEIVLPGVPSNWNEVQKALEPVNTLSEANAVLRARGIELPVSSNVTVPGENLPLDVLPRLLRMQTGEVIIYPRPPGIVIGQIVSVQEAPVDADKAGPLIQQFLMNRKRAEAVQAEVKRLRESAQVTYKGEFEAGAAAPAAAAQPAAAAPAAGDQGAAKAPDKNFIDQGVKGLK